MKRPIGALTDQEVRKLYLNPPPRNEAFYAVHTRADNFLSTPKGDTLAFCYSPHDGFYFRNFFHAWAYHQQCLKAKNETAKS